MNNIINSTENIEKTNSKYGIVNFDNLHNNNDY